jgi:serine/threonine-protein kinase
MGLAAGTRLGPYEIVAAIGAGGMGEVYRARDTRLDRTVAIKILPATLAADPQFRERFDREAKVISALEHPHICALYDVGEERLRPARGAGVERSEAAPRGWGPASSEEAVVHFIVLQYLEGETLAERLSRGPMPLEQALEIGIQIADALDRAHRQGIVHRDLKPGNVMLTKSGAKLLDFGLARTGAAVARASGASLLPTKQATLTTQGTILGTFQYMAPEQLEGSDADARTDIWAFGAVLYEMVTGRKAFEGKSHASLIGAILKDQPPPPSAVQPLSPSVLDQVIRRCLAKDPDDRWQTARDLVLQLKWVAEGSAAGVAPLAARRSKARLITAGTGVLIGAVLSGAAVWFLKAVPADRPVVMRFTVPLPEGQNFTRQGRHLLAVSPDGSRLVYVANQQLYLRRMGELEATPIRGTEGLDPTSPFFSPDGEWVGFWAGEQLKKIPVAGGGTVLLCPAENPFGASWKGGTILAGQGPQGILSVPAAGGTASIIIKVTPERAAHGPQMLPDGETVLFTLGAGAGQWDDAQIVAQSTASGARKVLVTGATDGRWVETGHLVYARAGILYAVPFDGTRLEVTGGPVPLIDGVQQPSVSGAAQFAVARTGLLAYVPGVIGDRRVLAWVDRQGREEPLKAEPRTYIYPRLSPDGKRIVIEVRDQAQDIWVWNSDSETLERLTVETSFEGYPIWTPDGRRIIYSSSGQANGGIFWRSADGAGGAERLTTSGNRQFPQTISPDGTLLVFREENPKTRTDLMLLSLDGKREVRPLINTEFLENNADISPDGRWLAYDSGESGSPEVYVRPFPNVGESRRQISTGGGTRPLWARSGRELYYRDSQGRLIAVPVRTGATFSADRPRVLLETRGYFPGIIGRAYDVSPDGRRVLLIKDAAAPSAPGMTIVANWFEELTARVPRP